MEEARVRLSARAGSTPTDRPFSLRHMGRAGAATGGMRRRCGVLLLLVALLAGCAAPPPPATPAVSPLPGPTVTADRSPMPPVSATPAPFTIATPAIILEPPETTPNPSPTQPKVGLPPEHLAILEPGPGSQVSSPIHVVGWGGPSWQQQVHIRLLGEDGKVVAQRITYLQAIPEVPGRFVADLGFDIPLVAEAARLEVSTYDLLDNRLDHLTTVNLVLLSAGAPLIYPALQGAEELAIFVPRENGVLQGGVGVVRGAGWLASGGPLTIEVLNRQGSVVGSATATLSTEAIGKLGTFEAQVPYKIELQQYGRVVVYETDSAIPGMVHYSSVRVFLKP